MPVIINFGDATTQGNTTLQQNLTIQGVSSTFTGNIYASSLTVGIGNAAVPFGNIWTYTANVSVINAATINAFVGIGTTVAGATLQVRGNLFASNALTTTNIFATNVNVSTTNTLAIYGQSGQVGVGTSTSLGATLQIQGNLFASNALSTTNIFATNVNVSTTNTLAIYGPSGQVGVGTSTGLGASLQVQGNIWSSNSLNTTNIFATNLNVSTANITSLVIPSFVVQGNLYASNAVQTTNVFATNVNATTMNVLSLFSPSGQIGIGTSTSLGATLQIQGNLYASNSITAPSVFYTTSNVLGTANIGSLVVTSNIGIGTSPVGNALEVFGNAYISNALTTTNLVSTALNVVSLNTATFIATSNGGIGTIAAGNALSVAGNVWVGNLVQTTNIVATTVNVGGTLNVASIFSPAGLGIGTTTASRTTVYVLGNVYVSNAFTTTNVVATTLNVTTANITSLFNVNPFSISSSNITTVNTASIYGQSGFVGINTSTNLGATLQVQGNIYASNSVSTPNVFATQLYYGEDLFKRGPYLTPSVANSATIQAWISATVNASAQPTQSWWATSSKPVYGNVASGPKGSTDYGGSVLLPDGRVLFVPQNASNIGIYNPATCLFSSIVVPGIDTAINKFRSGVLVPNGNVVFIPWSSSNVGVFNPLTYKYSNVQVGAAAAGGGLRFQGGVVAPTGNVVMVPRDSANIGIFNPTTLTMTNVGPIAGQGLSLFGAGVLLPNGNVIMSPLGTGANIGVYNSYSLVASGFSNVGPIASSGTWEGAVLAPNGNVIFPGTSSSNIVVYNPTFTTITAGAFSNIPTNADGTNRFQGGCLLPSGNIVCCPSDTSNVGLVDPVALTYSNCTPVSTATAKFFGCTLVPSGQVIFTPGTSANVGVLNTMVPAGPEFCLNPFFNKL
jgi:hypothetical protein